MEANRPLTTDGLSTSSPKTSRQETYSVKDWARSGSHIQFHHRVPLALRFPRTQSPSRPEPVSVRDMSNWTKSSHTDPGHGGQVAPSAFEQRVARYFYSQGWKIEIGKRTRGPEMNIYGIQKNVLAAPSYLIVECKEKGRVTYADVVQLTRKMKDFRDGIRRPRASGPGPEVKAVLAYAGDIDEGLRRASWILGAHIRVMKF